MQRLKLNLERITKNQQEAKELLQKEDENMDSIVRKSTIRTAVKLDIEGQDLSFWNKKIVRNLERQNSERAHHQVVDLTTNVTAKTPTPTLTQPQEFDQKVKVQEAKYKQKLIRAQSEEQVITKPILANLDFQADPIFEKVEEESAVAVANEQQYQSLAKIKTPVPIVENVPEVEFSPLLEKMNDAVITDAKIEIISPPVQVQPTQEIKQEIPSVIFD